MVNLLQNSYPDINWEGHAEYKYLGIQGTWHPLTEEEKCLYQEAEEPYANFSLDVSQDDIQRVSKYAYIINDKKVDTRDHFMKLCPADNPILASCSEEIAIKIFNRSETYLVSLRDQDWSEFDEIDINLDRRIKDLRKDLESFLLPLGYYAQFNFHEYNLRMDIKIKRQIPRWISY